MTGRRPASPPPQDPLRAAVDDLHRWDVSRGWPAFNVILARIDAALPAATEPADGLRLDAETVALYDAACLGLAFLADPVGLMGARDRYRDELRAALQPFRAAALRAEPVPGDGG